MVRELDPATDVYTALGAHVTEDERSTAAHRRLLTFGTNTLVELIAPHSEDTVAGRDLAANGEIMHACVFETADLAAAESHLVEHGVGIAERDGQRLTADPKTCHGAVIEFVGCA